MMKVFRICILLVLWCNISVSAQSVKDSLKQVLDGYLEDDARMNTLLALSNEYNGINPDSVEVFSRKALDMANRTMNQRVQARASFEMAHSFDERGMFDSSLFYFTRSKDIYVELKDSGWVVSTYSAIGNTLYYKGNHRGAIEQLSKALRLSEEWNLPVEGSNVHNNLAIVYSEQKFYSQALKHYLAAKAHYLSKNDPYSLGAVELNIGNIYAATQKPDSAIFYFLRADSLLRLTGHMYGLALNWTNLGEAFHAKNELNTSEAYFHKAIDAQKELQDDFGLAYSYARLAGVYVEKGKYVEAKRILTDAEQIGQKIGALRIIEMSSQGFQELYTNQRKWKLALEYNQRWIQYRDSIQNEETSKMISNLEHEYVNERKENEIIRLKSEQALNAAELRKKNLQLIASIAIALLLLLLVLVVGYFGNALKNANKSLNVQKQVIEKINQHMTDGIKSAERLQKGAFPNPFAQLPKPELSLLLS